MNVKKRIENDPEIQKRIRNFPGEKFSWDFRSKINLWCFYYEIFWSEHYKFWFLNVGHENFLHKPRFRKLSQRLVDSFFYHPDLQPNNPSDPTPGNFHRERPNQVQKLILRIKKWWEDHENDRQKEKSP